MLFCQRGFAAFVAVFGKIGLGKVDTTLATAIRAAVMALLLVIAAVALEKWDLSQITSKAYLYIFLAGLSGALSWFFYFFALKLGHATSVVAIERLSVVL